MVETAPIKLTCECMTFDIAIKLMKIIRELESSDAPLKRRIKHIEEVQDGLLKGLKAHEQITQEICKDILHVAKKRELNVKKFTTVPWEVDQTPKKRKKK